MPRYSYTPTTNAKSASNRAAFYTVALVALILAYLTPHLIFWFMKVMADFNAKVGAINIG